MVEDLFRTLHMVDSHRKVYEVDFEKHASLYVQLQFLTWWVAQHEETEIEQILIIFDEDIQEHVIRIIM